MIGSLYDAKVELRSWNVLGTEVGNLKLDSMEIDEVEKSKLKGETLELYRYRKLNNHYEKGSQRKAGVIEPRLPTGKSCLAGIQYSGGSRARLLSDGTVIAAGLEAQLCRSNNRWLPV
jgi:hypothetical protein